MNDAQIWTVIGVLTAGLFGILTLMSTLFLRVMNARFEQVTAQLSEKITVEVSRLERKVDGIDRDVQALTRRVFGDEPRG